MRVLYLFKWFVVFSLLSLLLSCSKEKIQGGKFENGLLVVNEGLFQTGNGTLTWIDEKTKEISRDIVASENEGLLLGNVAQSALLDGDKLYVCINNSNRIVVLERNTMKFVREIKEIPQVRYMVAYGDYVYASAWGDGFWGKVYKIRKSDGFVEGSSKEIRGPEKLCVWNNRILVPASGGFGNDNKVFVLDPLSLAIRDSFAVSDRPVDIQIRNNTPYLICSGKMDFFDPSNNTPGGIYKLENDSVQKLLELETGSRSLCLTSNESIFYFLTGNKIGVYDLRNNRLDYHLSPAITAYNMYVVKWENSNYLALCDAKDFVSSGEIFLVDPQNFQIVNRFTAEIIPSYVVNY